jgi:heavy metal sensor kinase
MRRAPIRLRVAAAFALAMAVVLAGTALFLYLRLGSHLSSAVDRDLRLRAQDLAALVRHAPAALAATSAGQVERGESYAQLLDVDGRVLDATRPLGGEALLGPPEIAQAVSAPLWGERPHVRGLDERSRFLATRVERNGRPLVLVVGATLGDRAETLAELRTELLIAGPIALLLASVAGYLLAGLSLRPVEEMRRSAATLSATALGGRLPVPPTGDELERLGRTLNELLERLEAFVTRERDFLADAGHELRSPLALLRAELELAVRHGGSEEELRQTMARSLEEVERLALLADDLLLIAQADRGELPLRMEEVAVAGLFATVASRFEWRAQELGKAIRWSETGVRVRGDRLRLEQALSNLVDNALRYGGDEVALEAVADEGRVELHVHDHGPGLPDDFTESAFERFSRADSARGSGGTGLGLAIVRAIAEAHGGTAGASGSDVWLSLDAV